MLTLLVRRVRSGSRLRTSVSSSVKTDSEFKISPYPGFRFPNSRTDASRGPRFTLGYALPFRKEGLGAVAETESSRGVFRLPN